MKRILLFFAILAVTATTAPAVFGFGFQKPVQVRASKQQMPLHGNVSSKVYHASGCKYYNSKSATAEFANAQEAEKAGYHACKICGGKEGVVTTEKHGPSCKYYLSKSATENFTSVEQAKQQGYRLCSICNGK